MRTLLALTVLSGSLFMIGCSSSDSAETESLDKDAENTASESGATAVRIGVLNRTKIYAALGLADEYRRRHQSINEIVQKEINRLTNQLKSMQQQYGANPTPEQSQQLKRYQASNQGTYQQLASGGKKDLDTLRKAHLEILNNKSDGPIQTVIERRNLQLVLNYQQASFTHLDPALDITEEVIEEIRKIDSEAIKLPEPKEPAGSAEEPELKLNGDAESTEDDPSAPYTPPSLDID